METLGVFDSGLGGFNIVANLRKHSDINIAFLADHKNLPYGRKNDEQLQAILKTNMQWFIDKGINKVLIACNTASTYIDFLRAEFPNLEIFSIIEITAKQFTNEKLVIFGTDKTCENKKYDEYMGYANNYHALSDLAEIIENNDKNEIKIYLKSELASYKRQDLNFLLACTHYSIVEDVFAKYLCGNIYDSVNVTIDYFKDYPGERKLDVYTSGNIKVLADQLYAIFDYEVMIKPFLEEYKIVLVSDNHGLLGPLIEVIDKHKDASLFIHCGDVELNDDILNKFYVVNGNNDYFSPFDDNLLIEIMDKKIYVTHGHEYMPFKRIDFLYQEAVNLDVDIVCFGHEHIYQVHEIKDKLIVNPASLNYNRDQSKPCYMVITVLADGYKTERIEVES